MGISGEVGLIRAGVLFAVLTLAGSAQADSGGSAQPQVIEIFSSSKYPVDGIPEQQKESGTTIHFYPIDGIHQLESGLSQELPADPEVAKSLVLKRLEQQKEDAIGRVQQSATGLAKAMQYDIDRYPAIVLDGDLVVYGLTDLNAALGHYRAWHLAIGP